MSNTRAVSTLLLPDWRLLLNAWVLFFLACGTYIGLSIITNTLILTDAVYYQSFAEQLTAERIQAFLSLQEQYAWIGHVLTPLILAVKMGYTALCLAVGALLAGYDGLTFKHTFKAALIAECVFIAAAVLRVAWGLWVLDVQTIEDFTTFAPLSALAFFNVDALSSWALYPLQALNAFEYLYVLALGAALSWLQTRSFSEFYDLSTLALVSYGMGFLLWLATATFLLLQIS